jgi:hypothetical protein
MVCVVLIVVLSSKAEAGDMFVSSYPKAVFEKWLRDADAQQVNEDEYRRTTLLGQSFIRTYNTNKGQRKLEIHRTIDGYIYDIGEYFDLGSVGDIYISSTIQIITSRIIWAALTHNEPYLRSVLASERIHVESPYLGSKESQVLGFVRANPNLHVGNFYLSIFEGSPVLSAETDNNFIKININPTIDLLLQGQVVLYQEILQKRLKNVENSAEEPFSIHPAYQFVHSETQFSYQLPKINYYQNERSYLRNGPQDQWIPTNRELLAIPEGRLASLVAHRWATLALNKEYRYRDVNVADSFMVNLAIEGKQLERIEIKSNQAIERLGDLFGRGLPAYYNTISAQRHENDEVHIKGVWLIIDPDLAYEHIFRITDVFRLDDSSRYVWMESQIRAILGVRIDHLNQRKIQIAPTKKEVPLFKINAN